MQRYSAPVKLLWVCQLTNNTFFFPPIGCERSFIGSSSVLLRARVFLRIIEHNQSVQASAGLFHKCLNQCFSNCLHFVIPWKFSRGGANLYVINLSLPRRCPPQSSWQTVQETSEAASWEWLTRPKVYVWTDIHLEHFQCEVWDEINISSDNFAFLFKSLSSINGISATLNLLLCETIYYHSGEFRNFQWYQVFHF